MRVLDHLLKAIRDAVVFNPEVQGAPACILWPDRDRQWEAVIPVLQAELPELMILGDRVSRSSNGNSNRERSRPGKKSSSRLGPGKMARSKV